MADHVRDPERPRTGSISGRRSQWHHPRIRLVVRSNDGAGLTHIWQSDECRSIAVLDPAYFFSKAELKSSHRSVRRLRLDRCEHLAGGNFVADGEADFVNSSISR